MFAVDRVRPIAAEMSKPRLQDHVKFQLDPARGKHVVMAPEKLFWPDDISVAILELCDGKRSLGAIADMLTADYEAPRDVILEDVLEFAQEWSDRLLLKL